VLILENRQKREEHGLLKIILKRLRLKRKQPQPLLHEQELQGTMVLKNWRMMMSVKSRKKKEGVLESNQLHRGRNLKQVIGLEFQLLSIKVMLKILQL